MAFLLLGSVGAGFAYAECSWDSVLFYCAPVESRLLVFMAFAAYLFWKAVLTLLLVCCKAKVVGIGTVASAAQMVDLKPFYKLSFEQNPCGLVGFEDAVVLAKSDVAVAIGAYGGSPIPASSSKVEFNLINEPIKQGFVGVASSVSRGIRFGHVSKHKKAADSNPLNWPYEGPRIANRLLSRMISYYSEAVQSLITSCQTPIPVST
jgi:hypothetical protein